jgi:tryptophanyl-tRNA synthetase
MVPVGQDQIQHLELTNDTVRWFNNRYGEYFKEVKPLLTEIPKVMSLLEPIKKMSKSLGVGHVIELGESPEKIEEKLKKAVTATEGGASSPGAENLLSLLKEFGNKKIYEQFAKAEKDGSIRYGELKKELAQAIGNYFADFREKQQTLLQNKSAVIEILEGGAQKAKKVAEKTIEEVRKLVGLYTLSK